MSNKKGLANDHLPPRLQPKPQPKPQPQPSQAATSPKK